MLGGKVAHQLQRVATLDQRHAFSQLPLQLERLDLEAVLLAPPTLLRLLVIVELAPDPVGSALV